VKPELVYLSTLKSRTDYTGKLESVHSAASCQLTLRRAVMSAAAGETTENSGALCARAAEILLDMGGNIYQDAAESSWVV
jgi:hypothetical protein